MGFIKRWFKKLRRNASDEAADIASDIKGSGTAFKLGGVAILVSLLCLIGLGMYWSSEPELFDVRARTVLEVGDQEVVIGSTSTATLITVAETLLDKPGGFLSNDIGPPGMWLDNMPNWEFGALVQVRDFSKAMRQSFSRSKSQSIEDKDLSTAEPRFHFDNASWALPASESEYREGIRYLRRYLKRLSDDDLTDAQFYSRADNLRDWLSTVETRLGSLSQRLSASVGQRRINTDLAGDGQAERATPAPAETYYKTPWLEVDDVFYEARGATWALIHLLKAVEIDFADVLKDKNALISLQQIIRELEETQASVYPPMILNGSGFGFVANHSLAMVSYISRANAAIIDLRELLTRG